MLQNQSPGFREGQSLTLSVSPEFVTLLPGKFAVGSPQLVCLQQPDRKSGLPHTLITTLPKWLPLSMCLSAATASANSKTRSITGCNWLTRIA